MPAPFKTTFIINGRDNGWQEVWWSTQADGPTALANSLPLAKARAGLLSASYEIEAVRVTNEPADGSSYITFTNAPSSDPVVGLLAPDTASNAALARIDAPPYRRQMWLRGIPDTWIVKNPDGTSTLNAQAGLKQGFNKFLTALTKAPVFQLRVLAKPPGVGPNLVSRKPITKLLADTGLAGQLGNPLGVILTSAAHGLFVGDEVRVGKVTGRGIPPPQVNGVYIVQKVLDADNFEVVMDKAIIPLGNAFTYYNKGYFIKRVITFVNITDGELIRYAKRDTGRRFFESRGRRRRRA